MYRFAFLLAACLAAAPAFAQPQRTLTDDPWCAEENGGYAGDDRERACEVREFVLSASALDLDPGQNGGISVKAWDREDVLVRVRVSAIAQTDAAARELLEESGVAISGGRVRADLPPTGRKEWATVSYQVFAPTRTDLSATTQNGGVSVDGVLGDVTVKALNGGIALRGVGGTVKARTVNGGISVALDGGRWSGEGLDVESTNGGISIALPDDYSAELEAKTRMGRISTEGLTVTVENSSRTTTESRTTTDGRERSRSYGDELRITLGDGGAPLRAVTQNGGISISF